MMKKYSLILLLSALALTVPAQIPEFRADITDMTPMSYPSRSGLSDFSFELRNDSAIVALPYMGEVYTPQFGQEGLNFSEPVYDVTCKQTKKNDGQILSFSVSHDIVNYRFTVTLWNNNRIDIFMRPSNAQTCRYTGDYVPSAIEP